MEQFLLNLLAGIIASAIVTFVCKRFIIYIVFKIHLG